MKFRLLILSVVLLGCSLYFGLYDLPRRNAVHGSQGKEAEGVIAAKGTRAGRRGRTEHLAKVRFKDAAGTVREVDNRFEEARWQGLRPGQKVPVRYLAADPTLAFAAGAVGGQKRDPLLDGLLLGGLLLGGLVAGGIGLRLRS